MEHPLDVSIWIALRKMNIFKDMKIFVVNFLERFTTESDYVLLFVFFVGPFFFFF